MDIKNIEKYVRKILEAIGEDPEREGLRDTPKRVAESFKELLEGYNKHQKDIRTVFTSGKYDGMIIVKDIDFYSLCEHHLLPFWGKAHIGYLPDDAIIGISKLPRLVEIYSKRLQSQERLTQQVADALMEILTPFGVGVTLEAEHLCMKMRGVEKQNSKVITSAFTGAFKEDQKTRGEFLHLIRSR